jgi:NAD(P)-dependent dehydrogenase (short-subunit alcohol dehydrogenase family)
MTQDYDGCVVVVTGASTGLGRAIAVGAAERGARAVIINYASSHEAAGETADLVRAAGATPVLAQGDVGHDASCRAIAQAAEPYGVIEALFNNAAMTVNAPNHADLDAVSADEFLNVYRVNLVGPYQMIRACRPLLEKSSRAAVVNVGSIASMTGLGTSVPYAASKGALSTLTLSLARALAPKIRVNLICPGHIDTPWFGKLHDEAGVEAIREGFRETNPLKVVSSAEDIAGAALFFGSPDARHVTGETMIVDAGMHLGFATRARH